MHRFLRFSLITSTLICGAVAASAQTTDIPSDEELEELGLEVRWVSQAELNVYRDKVAHVTNDENNIYVQSSAGIISAFDAENGRKLWSQQTGHSDEPATAAVSNKRMVIVCAGPNVYGYDKFTGAQRIDFRMAKQPAASPVMGEGVFYVPMAGGAIYAYSTNVLEHKFRYGTLPDDVAMPHAWRFISGETILHPPVLGEEALAFVSRAGNLHSVNTTGLARGRTRFQLILKEPASAPIAIADNSSSSSIIMLTEDNRVFSVDLIKGIVEWTYPMGRQLHMKPIVVGNAVYITSTSGTLTKISREEGSIHRGQPFEVPGYVAPVYIGAGMEDTAVPQAVQDTLEAAGQGVKLTTVIANGPAYRAGLQAGDILLSIAGIPTPTVDVAKEIIEAMPLRAEREFEVIRVDIGVLPQVVRFAEPLSVTDSESISAGVQIADVARDSAAAVAGVRQGDVVLKAGETPVSNIQAMQSAIAAAAPGSIDLQLLRDDEKISVSVALRIQDDPGLIPAISKISPKLSIPTQEWDVPGVLGLTAIGRYSVFGIDQARRLVAYNRMTSKVRGQVSVLRYNVRLHNSLTDQVYLITSSGEIVCLREIGPTVRMPDLSTLSNRAVVKSIKVRKDDPIEATGTLICELELPDGTVQPISSSHKGAVRRVYVKEGQEVEVDEPLVLISDDKFATYHQNPQQQPIDVELQDKNNAAAANPMP